MAVEVSFNGPYCHNCTDHMKESRGCISKPLQPYLYNGKEFPRCPVKMITPLSRFCQKYYRYFQKGFLPFEGTIMHQPAKLMEAFDIIEDTIARLQREEAEKKKT